MGSGVMMQAEAHSPLKLLVDVGLGFHAECNIVEAQQIASLQEVTAQVSRCHGPALDRSLAINQALLHVLTPSFSFRLNQSSHIFPRTQYNCRAMQYITRPSYSRLPEMHMVCAGQHHSLCSAMAGATGQAAQRMQGSMDCRAKDADIAPLAMQDLTERA